MPKILSAGNFYEFDCDKRYYEIGRILPRAIAIQSVRNGKNVYTPAQSDAQSLAKDVAPGAAQWHGAHQPNYFPHYYPAFNNQYGHIFYGQRGHRLRQMQRGPGGPRK
jgi:hypothetical protein